ncbi:MAG: N-acetylmuramoyl-L-alanine amidase [Geobacter sp.]|nr:MAG: N-acetylmuramoyl-L-alanine amidase [Geobacter sp.]
MRAIDLIVIHCAATPDGRPNTILDVDSWHRKIGWERKAKHRRAWHPELSSVGYHLFIAIDGLIHSGRSMDEIGAHAVGYNSQSIGICMCGTRKFTAEQWLSLREAVISLKEKFPRAKIVGHRDLPNVKKECPGFDVAGWLAAEMIPQKEHLLTKG